MTFAEKARKDYPEDIALELGRPRGCPHQYGYEGVPSNTECNRRTCSQCWEREIPEAFQPKTTKKTKAQLLNEIADLNKEVKRLDEEAKRLEKYARYENAANEIYAMQKAFENSGFTREEAFKLTRDLLYSALKNLF